MSFCHNCGQRLDDNQWRVCPQCGQPRIDLTTQPQENSDDKSSVGYALIHVGLIIVLFTVLGVISNSYRLGFDKYSTPSKE